MAHAAASGCGSSASLRLPRQAVSRKGLIKPPGYPGTRIRKLLVRLEQLLA
ncbi:MAG TPA: hypothetical protein VMM15_08260 [Bradyrhizobium sp.]|nr:hypothetical protein [Bradyrhizobium sp.]